VACLERCLGSTFQTGIDGGSINPDERLVASRLDNMAEDVLALPTSCGGKG
jgi:hypothetical protein